MADRPGEGGRRRRRGRRPASVPGLPPRPIGDDDDLALDAILVARSRRRRRRPTRHRALLAASAAFFLLLIAVATGAAFTGHAVLTRNCTLKDLRPISIGENSFVFAQDGSLLGVVPSSKNRQPLKLSAISPWLPKATIAIEDRRFWQHGALDYQGIARAAIKNLEAGRVLEGGSTITQELVRNLYIGSHDRTLARKVREACLSLKLAGIWTKRQILAAYLNEVFYGRHAYGAEAAAQTFFSTSARRLTLTQAALLAGLPQLPSVYDPLRHPEIALRRRNEVLGAMWTSGAIDGARYREALAQPLGLKPGTLYDDIRHPNFFGYAERQLVELYGRKRVQAGGLRVRTTIDPKLQAAARNAIASTLLEKTDPAAALVAIDPRTGAVKAMVNFLPSGRKLDFSLASQGHRQAGSAFKPFTLSTAVSRGISLSSTFSGPSSLTIDDPRCSYNGEPWEVHNYADETAGTDDLIGATAHSVNTIFAQLVVEVGPQNVARVAHRMGIESPLQAVCSITLGSQAVTPLEMANAYATLAARGIHHPAQALALVRGPDGKVLGRLKTKGARALGQNAADLVTYALQRVVTSGTGTGAALYSRPVAGKTGTAEDYRDAWFCGFVPQLVTCVWIGYPHAEKSMFNVEGYSVVFGGSLPATIWRRFMGVATAKMPVIGFPTPIFTGHTVSGSGYSSSDSGYSSGYDSSSSSSSSSSTPPPAPKVETVQAPSAPPPAPPPPPPPTQAPPSPPPPPPEPPPEPPDDGTTPPSG